MSEEWSVETRQYVEEEQEGAYRALAQQLGVGGDADAAFRHFAEPQMPLEYALQAPGDAEAITAAYRHYYSLPLPTKYEDPNRYPSMAMTFDVVKGEFRRAGRLHDPLPLLATLPTGDINGKSVVEPYGGATVIYFERGLFAFCNDIARLMGWILPTLTPEHLRDDDALARLPHSYTMPPQASQFFIATLEAYVTRGGSARVPVPPHNLFLCMMLLSTMEQFAMAHELSHIAQGHLNKEPSPKDELLADTEALGAMTTLSRQTSSWAFGFWACDLALVAFTLFYQTLALFALDGAPFEWIDALYPSPVERRQVLQQMGASEGPPAGVAAASELIGMSDALVERLWEIGGAAMLLDRRQGVRHSPMWSKLTARTFAPRTKGA